MSDYKRAVQKLNEQKETEVRKDYRCKANGCPNAASMENDCCYWHWRETDVLKWGELTHRIRTSWPHMANWGDQKKEMEEARAQERRAKLTHKPAGLRTMK